MNLEQVCKKIDFIFPKKYALEGDKVGLQVDSEEIHINKILSAYELTDSIVDEAIDLKCNLITVFHPLIFRAIKKIDREERVSGLVSRLIKNDIALYSIHTSFDTFPEGTNRIIADKLGINNISYLEEIDKSKNFGMGIVGLLERPLHLEEFLDKCSNVFKATLKYNAKGPKKIEKVAIIGGSGTSFLDKVENRKVDAFLTADTSYHDYHRADGTYYLIDPGHYEMEMYNSLAIASILQKELEVEIKVSRVMTNPTRSYFRMDAHSDQKEFINKIRF